MRHLDIFEGPLNKSVIVYHNIALSLSLQVTTITNYAHLKSISVTGDLSLIRYRLS